MTCKLLELNTHCLQTRHAMVVHNLSDENTLLEFVFLNVQALYPTALASPVCHHLIQTYRRLLTTDSQPGKYGEYLQRLLPV